MILLSSSVYLRGLPLFFLLPSPLPSLFPESNFWAYLRVYPVISQYCVSNAPCAFLQLSLAYLSRYFSVSSLMISLFTAGFMVVFFGVLYF